MTKKEAEQATKKLEQSGGPIHPCCEITFGNEGGWTKVNEFEGITRRDECADRIAASMSAVWMAKTPPDQDKMDKLVKAISVCAYKLTDAMIAEGRKEQK